MQPVTSVPEELRPVLREQLDRLVAGEWPELLTWVHEYGPDGTTLVPQPEAIWVQERAGATRRRNGGWHVVVPLWTQDEAPSDLSAELVVEEAGVARIASVHVL